MLKKIVRTILPLIVSAAFIYLLFRSLDFNQIYETFRTLNIPLLLLASAIMVIYFLSGAVRFVFLLRPKMQLSLVNSVKLNFALLLLTYALGALSEGIRVIYLTRKFVCGFQTAVAAHMADRLLSVWISFGMLILLAPIAYHSQIALLIFSGIFICLLISFFVSKTRFWPKWINETFDFFYHSLSNPRKFFAQLLCGLAGMIGTAISMWLLALALHLQLPLTTALALAPITVLASVIPFTYSGLGSREAALTYCIPLVTDISKEQAVALSLSIALCYLIACLPSIISVPKLLSKDGTVAAS